MHRISAIYANQSTAKCNISFLSAPYTSYLHRINKIYANYPLGGGNGIISTNILSARELLLIGQVSIFIRLKAYTSLYRLTRTSGKRFQEQYLINTETETKVSAETKPTTTVKKTPAKKNRKAGKKEKKIVNLTEGLTLGEFIEKSIKAGKTFKEATVYWKENGAATKNRGFKAKFYEVLKVRDFKADSDVLTYVKENGGSKNDILQVSFYYGLAELARIIRASSKPKAAKKVSAPIKKVATS